MIRLVRNLLPALFFAACASSQPPVSTSPQPASKPIVPDSVSGVVRAQTHTYPDPKMGVLYRYRAGEFRPDVYVYGKSDWGDPQSQARGFIATLDIYQQRGEYDSYQVLLTQSINLDINSRVLPGHEVLIKYLNRDRARDSYFAVVSLPTDEFVKFRITQAADPSATSKAREFANAWIARYLAPSRK